MNKLIVFMLGSCSTFSIHLGLMYVNWWDMLFTHAMSGWRGGECGDRGLVTTTLERTRKDKVMLYEKGARSTAPFVIDRGVRAKNINCTDVCCTKLCNWVERVTFGLKKQMW